MSWPIRGLGAVLALVTVAGGLSLVMTGVVWLDGIQLERHLSRTVATAPAPAVTVSVVSADVRVLAGSPGTVSVQQEVGARGLTRGIAETAVGALTAAVSATAAGDAVVVSADRSPCCFSSAVVAKSNDALVVHVPAGATLRVTTVSGDVQVGALSGPIDISTTSGAVTLTGVTASHLASGAAREAALATSMATAGRAITFSGLTVAAGLSAMLFYQGSSLPSMGIAGAIVVGLAVLYGLTFLPALLAILGPSVDRLRLPFARVGRPGVRGFWHRLAMMVMRRPLLPLVPAVALLVAAGLPFLGMRLGGGGVDQLPQRLEARQAYDTLVRDFPGQDQTTFTVVVDYGSGSPGTSPHVAQVRALAGHLGAIPGVLRVDPPQQGSHIAVLNVVSNRQPSSDGARTILASVRARQVPDARRSTGGAATTPAPSPWACSGAAG